MPIVVGPQVGVGHSAYLFELLDAVLERRYQTQRRAMVRCQRLAVQLIDKQRLRKLSSKAVA
jgi:hypothetical protein